MLMQQDIKKILEFQKKRDWKQFHLPKNLAISLAIEASEVMEIFQWTKDNKFPKEKKQQLAEELADVYYYLLLMSHECNIDIKKAFQYKMKKNAKNYPIKKSKGNSKKYTEFK